MQKAFETHVNWERFLMSHRVTSFESGLRLDQFLKERYKKRSRNLLQQAIFNGRIKVSRPAEKEAHTTLGHLKPSLTLLEGDVVYVESQKKEEPPVNFNYRVLFEDAYFIVVDKPPFLPVHPAGRFYFHTLLTHLRTQGFTTPLDSEQQFYLPHRIDKDTSGLLLVAKTSEVCDLLSGKFRNRSIEKTYLALVSHSPENKPLNFFEVKTPIARAPHSLIKIKMVPTPIDQGGLASHTIFEKVKSFPNFTLLKCHLKTGRQHQIRVHLASEGFPIVGDKLYSLEESEAVQFYDTPKGKNLPLAHLRPAHLKTYERFISAELSQKLILPRHALHAHELLFTHPITQKELRFTSPLASDLEEFLNTQNHSIPSDAIEPH